MARDFNGSTDLISYTNVADLTNSDITVACIVKLDTVVGDRSIFSIRELFASDRFNLGLTSDAIFVERYRTSGSGYRVGAASLGTTNPYQFVATSVPGTAATNMRLFRDGIEESYIDSGDASGDASPHTGPWRLGNEAYGSLDGQLAEVGVWNRVLTADEIAALGKRLAPTWIRRGLLFYAPLLRSEANRISGVNGSVTGTAEAVHPRVFYTSAVRSALLESAGGGTPEVDGITGVPTQTHLPTTTQISVAGKYAIVR